jgi:Prolyl-tRNA synthetase
MEKNLRKKRVSRWDIFSNWVGKYSEKLKAKFSDKDGQLKNLWRGCYGIGVTRIAQAAIEQNQDQKGICWPIQISPLEVIIIPTNLKDPIQSDLTEGNL